MVHHALAERTVRASARKYSLVRVVAFWNGPPSNYTPSINVRASMSLDIVDDDGRHCGDEFYLFADNEFILKRISGN